MNPMNNKQNIIESNCNNDEIVGGAVNNEVCYEWTKEGLVDQNECDNNDDNK